MRNKTGNIKGYYKSMTSEMVEVFTPSGGQSTFTAGND